MVLVPKPIDIQGPAAQAYEAQPRERRDHVNSFSSFDTNKCKGSPAICLLPDPPSATFVRLFRDHVEEAIHQSAEKR